MREQKNLIYLSLIMLIPEIYFLNRGKTENQPINTVTDCVGNSEGILAPLNNTENLVGVNKENHWNEMILKLQNVKSSTINCKKQRILAYVHCTHVLKYNKYLNEIKNFVLNNKQIRIER